MIIMNKILGPALLRLSLSHDLSENKSKQNPHPSKTEPVMPAPKDLYKLLGIPRNATKKAIREAYYQRAKQLHPDRQKKKGESDSSTGAVPSSPANSKIKEDVNSQLFKEITQAYQILSNDEERRKYDMQQQYGGSGAGAAGSGSGGDFNVDAQSAYEYWYALHRRRMMEEQQRMKDWQSDPSQYHSYFDSDGGDYYEYRYKRYYQYHKSPHSFNDFYNSRYGAAGMGPGFSIHRGIRRSMNRNRAMLLRFWLIFGCMILIYLTMAMLNQYRWYRIPEEEAMYYNQHYAAQRRAVQQQQQQQIEDDPFALQEMQYRRAIERRRQRRKEEEELKKKKKKRDVKQE